MAPVPVPILPPSVGATVGLELGVNYGTLSQKHDEYDAALLEELEDLYVGGYAIQRKAAQYLPILVGEHASRHKERCTVSSFQPIYSQVVDQFTSDVFGQPLSVKPAADADNPNTPGEVPDKDFYSEFEKDCDKRGTSFVDLMVDTLRTALKKRYALVCIDAPEGDPSAPPPASLAEEERLGTRRLYAYECPIEQLIDWRCDDRGGFVWAILNKRERERETPFDRRGLTRETFTVWSMVDGFASWMRYVISYDKDKPPKADEPLVKNGEGTTSFRRIPILRFELPAGLWVGNKIGTQQKEHYQRRSALISAENRSMVAIPFVAQGDQANAVGGPIPAEIAQDQDRGTNPVATFTSMGWLKLAKGDVFDFAEPAGHCYDLVDKQLGALAQEMRQVTFQMAASIRPTGAALGRSGLSKQKDEDLTARVLRALGHLIRGFSVLIFDTIAKARGEDVHWTPHGLDAYDSEDREQLLEEAISLDQVQIPSPTFRKVHKRAIAGKLLKGSVDPETMSTINTEIEDGVDAEEEMRQLMTDAKKDAIQNPPPPIVMSPMPPGVKRPLTKSASPPPQPGAANGRT